MPVPDRGITLLKKRMLWKIVLLHIIINILFCPRQKRPQRPKSPYRIQGGHAATMIGLTTAYTTGPAMHIQIVEGTIEGMDLADLVVELSILSLAGFPKATVDRLHPCRRKIGLHYPQIKGQ